jgi:hypothetical protein
LACKSNVAMRPELWQPAIPIKPVKIKAAPHDNFLRRRYKKPAPLID